jgi:phage terminase small subunit
MVDKFNTRERELYVDLLDRLPEKKSLADLKLLQALAVEMALYEEATAHLQIRKTITQGVKHEIPSAWIGIRNAALKNMQNITKQLGISELAKDEKPVAKIAKLELLKNGKKNPIQKAAGE